MPSWAAGTCGALLIAVMAAFGSILVFDGMDLLKREAAPITARAWEEIDRQTSVLLDSALTARTIATVEGPYGWEYSAVALGHIKHVTRDDASGLEYGLRSVLPLVEQRVFFELDIWELDNIERGARDVDLSALQTAIQRAVLFEEGAVLRGLPDAGIRGLSQSDGHAAVPVGAAAKEIVDGAARAIALLQQVSIAGPYALIVSPSFWQALTEPVGAYPGFEFVKGLLNGQVILSPLIESALLVSLRGGDYRLVLGQDFSVGYHSHSTERVRLYITESFTFQMREPRAVVRLAA